MDLEKCKDRNEYSLGEGSERIIKGLEFVRKKPQGTVIFTGFSGALIHEGLSEAEIIEKLIEAQCRLDKYSI